MGSAEVGILAPSNVTVQAFLEAPQGDFNYLRLAWLNAKLPVVLESF